MPDSSIAGEIKNILQNLNSENAENSFREIFCKILGFEYSESHPLYLPELEDELDGDLVTIAKTNPDIGEPFYVLYGKSPKITKTSRRKIVKKIVNEFSYEEEASFILILEDEYRGIWEIVSYATLFGRLQLRIFKVGPGEAHRTTAENLAKLKLENANITRSKVAEMVENAFSVEPVTEEFFEEYKCVIKHLREYIERMYNSQLESSTPTGISPQLFIYRASKSFAHTLLNRLMFIMFLQKKGWIGGRKNFLQWLYEVYENNDFEDFYGEFLRPLFLDVLNRPHSEKVEFVKSLNLPDEVKEAYLSIHYYNGGLFNHLYEFGVDLDDIIKSFTGENGKEVIKEVMELLHKYNFTISEESPFEVEVAVDPAMLGYLYESLIAEEERGSAGIFYTPKEEVDFMCRMALYNHLSKVADRDVLLKLLFSEENVIVPREVIDELDKIKIVDPASGSGAFLVGMFNVIKEIYEKAGVRVDFERKKKIIRENLHGVDVKEWAVRVAELRLWLALIEDEENMPNYEPLLPNLTPNLRVGDSLVSEGITVDNFTLGGVKIAGVPLHLKISRDMVNAMRRQKEKIIELKRKVFNGEISVVEFEKERIRLFVEAVSSTGLQRTLQNSATAESEEIERLIDAFNSGKSIQIPFFWDFDFADVSGFDVVIANPPYVRQESIYPEFFDPDELELLDINVSKLKDAYKKAIIENTKKIVDTSINKRSDIYTYFFMRGLKLLKHGGTLVFITSNSWLDVGYGEWMQEAFLKYTHLRYVFDYPHRSFKEADVNTVITVMEKKGDILLSPDARVKFVKLKKKIGTLLYEDFREIVTIDDGESVKVFDAEVISVETDTGRYRILDEVNLAKLGWARVQRAEMGEEEKYSFTNYAGAKWGGILIRAPEIFYTILRKGGDKLVRLGEIADVKRGFTTGANEFFYLEPIKNPDAWPKCEICGRVHGPDEGLIAVKNGAGWIGYIEEEFLKPVIISPREIKKPLIFERNLKRMAFICDESKDSLRSSRKLHALNYIQWGEQKGYPQRTTLRGRRPWYGLVPHNTPDVLWPMIHNDRLIVGILQSKNIVVDHNLFEITTNEKGSSLTLFASLFATYQALVRELIGRANLGEGALKTEGVDIQKLIIFKFSALNNHTEQLENVFERLKNYEIKSIFEELGLPRPNRDLSNINPEDVSLDGVMPDRRELDRIIFEALGLTEEEQLEVYRAVVELVKERLVKARTFGR